MFADFHICLVEDETDVARIVAKVLADFGYVIKTVYGAGYLLSTTVSWG